MKHRISREIVMVVLLAWPASAHALTGQETIVIANSESKESVDLAKFYMEARSVPAGQLLLVKTTTKFEISRADYQSQIRQPLLDMLLKDNLADKIRCVVCIWGVPVRITAGQAPASNPGDEAARVAVGRAHYRLAVDYKLLNKVGGSFPASMPADLLPAARQFDLPPQTAPDPLGDLEGLLKDIAALAARKQTEIRRLTKPEEQALAHRQLMSLHAEIYGMKGLLAYIDDWRPPKAPAAQDVKKVLDDAEKRLDEVRQQPLTPETAAQKAMLLERVGGLALVTTMTAVLVGGQTTELVAVSVDGDLALVLWSDQQRQFFRQAVRFNSPGQAVPNASHWRFADAAAGKFPKAILTARLDGETAGVAKKALAGALATEKTGLAGTFYIDAGVGAFSKTPQPPYVEFDSHLKKLHAIAAAKGSMKTVLEDTAAVFAPGTCPDAALYAGWYSLKNYVPAFKWLPGSVGIHYASWEATELREAGSKAWCNHMIEEGVAVTVGATNEPYLQSFVMPDEFFPLLMTGKYTVGECFERTNPLLNWRMILIGDPLYNPFAAKPAMKVEDLPKGLAP